MTGIGAQRREAAARRRRLPLVLLLVLAGCAARPVAAPPPPEPPAGPRAADLPRVGRFAGTLPCPDCAGIEADLVLAADWDGRYLYRLTEVRRGAAGAAERRESEGTWATLRGTPLAPDAVVYQLDPDRRGTRLHFIVIDERRIRLLDESLSPVGDPLHRVDGR